MGASAQEGGWVTSARQQAREANGRGESVGGGGRRQLKNGGRGACLPPHEVRWGRRQAPGERANVRERSWGGQRGQMGTLHVCMWWRAKARGTCRRRETKRSASVARAWRRRRRAKTSPEKRLRSPASTAAERALAGLGTCQSAGAARRASGSRSRAAASGRSRAGSVQEWGGRRLMVGEGQRGAAAATLLRRRGGPASEAAAAHETQRARSSSAAAVLAVPPSPTPPQPSNTAANKELRVYSVSLLSPLLTRRNSA